VYKWFWSTLYITVYDRIYWDFPASSTVATMHELHHRANNEIPHTTHVPRDVLQVSNTVHAPFIYIWYMVLANPRYMQMLRVGQNCVHTLYMTVYLVISLTKLPYIHRIYGSGQPYKCWMDGWMSWTSPCGSLKNLCKFKWIFADPWWMLIDLG
jgi:hypothetical protein